MARLDGWEARYAAVMDDARRKPYLVGQHDCFRLACAVLEALTGEDRWPEFAGQYSSRREAMRLLARHGRNFDEAGDWFFRGARVPMTQGRRGDIAKYFDSESHLGVITGGQVAVLAESGLVAVPRSVCGHCWRIG